MAEYLTPHSTESSPWQPIKISSTSQHTMRSKWKSTGRDTIFRYCEMHHFVHMSAGHLARSRGNTHRFMFARALADCKRSSTAHADCLPFCGSLCRLAFPPFHDNIWLVTPFQGHLPRLSDQPAQPVSRLHCSRDLRSHHRHQTIHWTAGVG